MIQNFKAVAPFVKTGNGTAALLPCAMNNVDEAKGCEERGPRGTTRLISMPDLFSKLPHSINRKRHRADERLTHFLFLQMKQLIPLDLSLNGDRFKGRL